MRPWNEPSGERRRLIPGLLLLLLLSSACKKDHDDPPPPLSTIRLFLVDDDNQWIRELNPDTGELRNFFPAPTQISSSGCALGYNSGADVLYFVDSSDTSTIYRILPAQSGPGNVDFVSLPTQAFFAYDGLGFDGQWLLALDSARDIIDALDPGTGEIQETMTYPVDLEGGLDASFAQGIFASGFVSALGENVLYHLDSQGTATDVFQLGPGFDPKGIAVSKHYLFVSDISARQIRVFSIGRSGAVLTLTDVKTLGFPGDSTVSALAAGP